MGDAAPRDRPAERRPGRHVRQAKLAEIGALGQARIAKAVVAVGLDGLAAEMAVRYLAGAGVACVCVKSEELAALAHGIDPEVRVEVADGLVTSDGISAFELRDPIARDAAAGALAALRAIRRALEEAP